MEALETTMRENLGGLVARSSCDAELHMPPSHRVEFIHTGAHLDDCSCETPTAEKRCRLWRLRTCGRLLGQQRLRRLSEPTQKNPKALKTVMLDDEEEEEAGLSSAQPLTQRDDDALAKTQSATLVPTRSTLRFSPNAEQNKRA
eukprot:4787142-Amphidinium_carterae.3